MPWQRLVADVGGEIDPATGRLAYREVVVTVMRQSGKSTLVFGTECERCLSWDTPQRVAYTAQTGWDARRKLLEDHVPIIQQSPLFAAVDKVYRGAGMEAVLFKTGSRIDVMASSASAGHGRTLDLGVIDEAFDDQDDRREQAILPAMATKPDGQLLIVSTAGTMTSTYLRRKTEAGRHAAVSNPGHGTAYFEWSVPDDADVDDPETWWTYMPALGWTITEPVVAHARSSMSDGEFRRSWCNQWVAGDQDRLIPAEVWDAVLDPTATPSGPLKLGLDVLPDRSAAALAVAGDGAGELVDHRPGVGWLLERTVDVAKRHSAPVVLDGGGPAAPVADELEDAGVKVIRLASADVAAACGRIFDAIADGKIRVRPSGPLDAAVAGVAKKPVGDRFVWSRSTSSDDVTPFMALTLAHAHGQQEVAPFIAFA